MKSRTFTRNSILALGAAAAMAGTILAGPAAVAAPVGLPADLGASPGSRRPPALPASRASGASAGFYRIRPAYPSRATTSMSVADGGQKRRTGAYGEVPSPLDTCSHIRSVQRDSPDARDRSMPQLVTMAR